MTVKNERREHDRYTGQHLKALVKPYFGEGEDWGRGEISTIDFNRNGMGMETDAYFAVGEFVKLVIRTDDAMITELPGVICNRCKMGDSYRFGVRFELDLQGDDSDFHEQLVELELQAATLQ